MRLAQHKELQEIFQDEYDTTSSQRTRNKNKMQYQFAYSNYVNEGKYVFNHFFLFIFKSVPKISNPI